jgi:hypothetical protein
LVEDKLRVTADVKPLDIELSGDAQAIDEGLVLCHVVGHAELQSNNVEELIALCGDQHNASPDPIESERVIKVYTPVLLGHRGAGGGGLLCLSPFHHEVCQSLGLDGCLRDLGYVKPHELESPLGDPSRGEAISEDLLEPL